MKSSTFNWLALGDLSSAGRMTSQSAATVRCCCGVRLNGHKSPGLYTSINFGSVPYPDAAGAVAKLFPLSNDMEAVAATTHLIASRLDIRFILFTSDLSFLQLIEQVVAGPPCVG